MSEGNPVIFHEGDDSEILQASQKARETFRYFWNQVALDFNRIIPALELACVKAPFSDDIDNPQSPVEHMWIDQINFDGINVYGVLLNTPNSLTSLSQGDEVQIPIGNVSDWLCVLDGKVNGAHTIQVTRGRMAVAELQDYDQAWGQDFPPPDTVLIPEHNGEFEDKIANLLSEQIAKNPAILTATYDGGQTLLHLEALHGREPSVKVLLEQGAIRTMRCDRGWTPLDYAQSLEWTNIIQLLQEKSKDTHHHLNGI
ncbi:MAG: DUF2314 domain-containing protein [Leptolyngbyaceae cyanobacterium MAG.088]|nr:DUF2314 domain-containing protein [Leptolyngbyaceae cyanobacterium MAG.088]